jgi:phosphatidylglycerol:prolipoprotein diacylglycerol transferase
MHPLLTVLHFHGVSRALGSYGALLCIALLVGAAITLRVGSKRGLESGALISALAGAIAAGFSGAYLLSVLVLSSQLGWIGAIEHPGIVFYGALLSGGLGLCVCARAFELPVAASLDACLPGLPVAHALGRVGCFLGGCCYGAPSALPWAVTYRDPLAPAAQLMVARHPWPLYEALCLLLLAALFTRQPLSSEPAGRRAALYVLVYAAVRCALEPLRGDRVRGLFLHDAYSLSQLISVAVMSAVLGFLLWQRRAQRRHFAPDRPACR